uniref:Septin-type G domain-containing protein n=1 Tax=Macrostomum lignano TaxID=282301 RepID=A0A1I8IFH5_9PLAT
SVDSHDSVGGGSTGNGGSGGPGSNVRLGFANLPDQMHRKAVKKGFNFTLMVVGESGLGKSTLISSLFQQDLYKDRELGSATERVNKTTEIDKRQIELDEKGVKLRLTVVDTPGFNDAINCQDCWRPIEDYIDNTFEQYFKDECGLNRKNIVDHRVHCCLYFVSPCGHGLRPIDVELMRREHSSIIARADTLARFKRARTGRLGSPKLCTTYRQEPDTPDRRRRGPTIWRQDQSGLVVDGVGPTVENPKHCDFAKLRIFLLGTHMQDLKDITKEVHYENYRAKYITERMSKRKGAVRDDFETR